MTVAAESLEGRTLTSGWYIKRKIPSNKDNSQLTGGHFSVGYEVEKNGQVAFLKALDFSGAFANDPNDPAATMNRITAAFDFEKSMLETCRKARIKKVVKLLDDGVETVEGADAPNKTQYFILEWAKSDIRKEAISSRLFDHAWALKCMHGITTGLYHLHERQIIHQDIKPSNILLFERDGVKIGDFGRSYSATHIEVEHNKNNLFPGDNTYAPPESLYRYATGSNEVIRKGADIYMLGSMLHFFFTHIPLTPKIVEKLPSQFHPTTHRWDREQIMPYLQHSYDSVVAEFSQLVHENFQEEISAILRQLTDPNPEKRGHPSAHRSHENNFSLQRYVSIFDRLFRRHLLRLKNLE